MITFFVALALLVAGYFTYGKVVERIFGPVRTGPSALILTVTTLKRPTRPSRAAGIFP